MPSLKKLLNLLASPSELYTRWRFGPRPKSLLSHRFTGKANDFMHVAAFTPRNAGDTLLTVVLEDLFRNCAPNIHWHCRHVHLQMDSRSIQSFNKCQAVVIGGGGLFIEDTNANDRSGWQWDCSIDQLRDIRPPLVIFAVGYNQFRNSKGFRSIFKNQLLETVKKSSFFGLRNMGSVRSVKAILPSSLREKVTFQPCMTTLISRLYPDFFIDELVNEPPFIALNCAFDRERQRYGEDTHKVLTQIARGVSAFQPQFELKYYSHASSDLRMCEVLREQNVNFDVVKINELTPRKMIEAYRRPVVAIGMRGHAQLIPFGCNTPIVSLVSHDKLAWFLEDVEMQEFGVDLAFEGVEDNLNAAVSTILVDVDSVRARIAQQQSQLWDVSIKNIREILDFTP